MNSFKVFLLMISLMVLFAVAGFMFGGQQGMVMAFIFAMGLNFLTYWYSARLVLRMYKAREVTEADHPRLFRIVKSVTTKSMMPQPSIYIIPTKAPNAFATGRNEEHAAVAVTEGMLELLDNDELEGVIGHEFAHIQNKDMLIGTIAATFVGAISIIATMARWGAIFGGYSRENNRGGGLSLLLSALLAPLMAVIIQTAISRQREYKADETGGKITGQYLALARALEKLHRQPQRLNLDSRPGTASMMIVNPISGRTFSRMFSTHPPVEKRIEKLENLSRDSVYQAL